MQVEKLRSLIRESIQEYIKEIDIAAEGAAMEARITKCEEAITSRETKLENLRNLEEAAGMLDENKVKAMENEIKELKKAKLKFERLAEKRAAKLAGKDKKKVTIDAKTEEAPIDEADVTAQMEMSNDEMKEEALNESFLKMQKLAGVITESQYNSKKKALVENQLNENTKHSELKPLEDILLKNGYKFIGDNIGFSDKATYEKEANKINTYEISLFKDYLDKYPVRILYFVGEDFTFSNGEKMNRGQADIRYNSIEDAKKDLEGISVINTTKQI